MRTMLFGAAAVTATLVAVTATMPADATGAPHQGQRAPVYKTVAHGLHGPRQLTSPTATCMSPRRVRGATAPASSVVKARPATAAPAR